MNSLLKKLFLLLFSLFAIAISATAQDLQMYVAGTDFEPLSWKSHPFYLKEYGNNSSNNNSLAFNNSNIFVQDIVVYDNVNYQGRLVHVNQGYNIDPYGYKAANSNTVPLNKYIVTTPKKVGTVGGLQVRKDDSYSNNGMFITKTETGKTTCILYYTIKNLKKGEAYQVKVGFVNLAKKTANDGSLAVKLRYKIHGIKEDGTIGGQLIENEWNLNTSGGIKNLETKSSQIIKASDMNQYVGLVLTILNNGSEANHVFGLDYINVYSKNNIVVVEKTDRPSSTNYEGCVETTGEDVQLSTLVRLPRIITGVLKFYEDAALTREVTTFNTGTVTNGKKTYYYTYKEEGKTISDTGTLTVNIKPNQTINITANPSNATLTCSVTEVSLSGPDATTQYEWINPNGDTGLGINFLAGTKGIYTIKGTGSNGCPASGTIEVKENKSAPSISALTSKDSKNNQTKEITCSETTLTITPTVSSTNVTYEWSGVDDFSAASKTINVDKAGTYTLVVRDKTTGCPSDPMSITIEDATEKPQITSVTVENKDGGNEALVTCTYDELTLTPSVTSYKDNAVSYAWNTGESTSSIKVNKEGEYSLMITDTKTGCVSEEFKVSVAQNTTKPEIEKIVSTNANSVETNIITCTDATLTLTPVLVQNSISPAEAGLEYAWSTNETSETINVSSAKTYSLVVTNTDNGCVSEKAEIEITKDESVPTIEIKSYSTEIPSIGTETNTITCSTTEIYLVATVTPSDVTYIWENDETKNESTYKVEEAGTYSLKVINNATGCTATETIDVASSLTPATTPTINGAKLNYCPDQGKVALMSLISSVDNSLQYTFYDASGEEMKEDSINTNAPNTLTTYTVTATGANGCESASAEFEVKIYGYVDFDLQLSDTRVLAGGNKTVATIIPESVEADQYQWFLNGEEVEVEGLQYATNLYIDTEYEVKATSTCDTKTQKASIEVIWPTAFTPHNDNDKNEDFAKGLPIIVFNRFYTKIYEGKDGWDGTINGTMNESESIAVPGVYYYSVILPNGEIKKGTIEIVE
jgi:hypothetical protein